MFKKNFLSIVYFAVFAFLAVFCFYKIQERDLIIRLNNHNLSQNAYEVTVAPQTTLKQFNKWLDDDDAIKSVQVHCQDKQHKNVTYFYGKGHYAVPPMISGQFFSPSDMQSEVSVAVVGKNVAKKLYTPKDQSYLFINGQYMPVIGVMGDKYHSRLDNQIFISESQRAVGKMKAGNYRIVLDGRKKLDPHNLKTALHATKVRTIVSKRLTVAGPTWIGQHWAQLLGLMLVLVAYFGATFVRIFRSEQQMLTLKTALKESQSRLLFHETNRFALVSGIGTLVGTLIGTMSYTFTTYTGILVFIVLVYCINLVFFRSLGALVLDRQRM